MTIRCLVSSRRTTWFSVWATFHRTHLLRDSILSPQPMDMVALPNNNHPAPSRPGLPLPWLPANSNQVHSICSSPLLTLHTCSSNNSNTLLSITMVVFLSNQASSHPSATSHIHHKFQILVTFWLFCLLLKYRSTATIEPLRILRPQQEAMNKYIHVM